MRRIVRATVIFSLILLAPVPVHSQKAGQQSIFELIRSGDIARLQLRLRQEPPFAGERSINGASPLMYAAYLKKADMVDLIRRNQAELSFFEACIVGDTTSLQKALARGQDVNQRSTDGFTPLGLAVFFRQPQAMRVLVDAGADINAKAANAQQVAPIHAAVAQGDLPTVEFLLVRGADPNLTQQKLVRPLHDAAASGNLPAVAMLLMFGADAAARTEEGLSAADLARTSDHPELAARLQALATSP